MIGLPSSVAFRPAIKYGIGLAMLPSTAGTFDFVIQAATAAASTTWTEIYRAPTGQANETLHVVTTARPGQTLFFRGYHIKPGFAASTFTSAVSGTAKPLLAPLMGLPLAAESRKLRLSHAEALYEQTTAPWHGDDLGIAPNTTGVSRNFRLAFTLPVGITIKKMEIHCKRTGAGSTASFAFNRINDTPGATLLASYNATTGAAKQILSSTHSELVTSTKSFLVRGTLKTTSLALGTGSIFYFADVTYNLPSLAFGV